MSFTISPIAESLSAFLNANPYTNIQVLVDENTFHYCYPIIKSILPKHHLIKIKSGEQQKHLGTCQTIWESITHHELDSHALMINLGGGVIGGFLGLKRCLNFSF